jgi:hypothetical protein
VIRKEADIMSGADASETGDDHRDAGADAIWGRGVDRSHNRDTLSSEAMTEMLRDIQDAMLALDERLAALESTQVGASGDTRNLALGVADMGDALARRVRALEQDSKSTAPILAQSILPQPKKAVRHPPPNRIAWSVALVFVIAVMAAAFWMLRSESTDRAAITSPPAIAHATPKVADTAPARAPTETHAPTDSAAQASQRLPP